MTDPIVRLENSRLSVEPGGQGQTLVTVRNLGNIVEGFHLQVLGEGVAEWAQVTPAEVQVYPEQEATAVVVFAPPAGFGIRSGTFPFAVRAESVVDPGTSAVAEGDIEIGRVFGLQAKITPVTSTGRWRGKHFIEITNWGNAPVQLKLQASDPDDRLAFLIGPELLDLPLGVTGHARVRVRTLKPFLRGTQVRLPFQVVGEPDPPEVQTGPPSMLPNPRRATLDGAFVQKPILSRLTVTLAAVLVLALGGLVAFLLTRGSDSTGPGGLAEGPPRTPALSAVSAGPNSVQLLWEAQPNIQNYKINTLTPDGKTTGTTSVDGALDTFAVDKLEPATDYCFQLQAVRGDQTSPLSEKQCAKTGVAAVASPTPSPTVAGSAAEISPSPTALPSAASSAPISAGASAGAGTSAGASAGVSQQAGGVVPVIPGGGGGAGGSTAAGGGAAGSGGSGASAGQTAGGAGTGVPAFGPTQFVNVLFTIPASDAQSEGRAEGRRQQLVAAGIPAQTLRTKDFPQLRLVAGTTAPVDSFLVYVGPFNSEQDAKTYCGSQPSLQTLCLPVRPNPGS